MRLGELMPILSVSAYHFNPEIEILQTTFPTLIVCPILGWIPDTSLIPDEKTKRIRDLFRQMWGYQAEPWVSRDASWRVSMT